MNRRVVVRNRAFSADQSALFVLIVPDDLCPVLVLLLLLLLLLLALSLPAGRDDKKRTRARHQVMGARGVVGQVVGAIKRSGQSMFLHALRR